jgi:hypothetical protein
MPNNAVHTIIQSAKKLPMRSAILLFALSSLATSCTHYYYSPNLLNTPHFERKHDASIAANIGGGVDALSTNVQLAYSPVKHATVMLNYFQYRGRFENTNFFGGPTYQEGTKGDFFEAAVGAYKPELFAGMNMAIYAGWGQGNIRNDYGLFRYAQLQYQRTFLQPTMTFKNDWAFVGIGLRLVHLRFTSGNIDYRIEPYDLEEIRAIEYQSPFLIPEGGLNVGFNLRPVVLHGSLVLSNLASQSDVYFKRVNLNVGITFVLHEMFQKKKRTSKLRD